MATSPMRRLLPFLPAYLPVALALGLCMNALGHILCIAYFKHWWQVVTCYWGYVVPVALLIRNRSTLDQLAWGVVSMVPLELAGYGFGTSIACPGNAIEALLGPRNFSLAMIAICGPLPWLLNAISARLLGRRYPKAVGAAPEASL
jgi:hypothetical protein